jgi:hypothetical protein
VQPDAIAPILGIPIDVVDTHAVGEGATQAFSTRQLIEPRVKWFIGVAAVITRRYIARKKSTHAQRYNRQRRTGESVHRGLQMIVLRGPTTKRSGRPGENEFACASLLIRIDSWKATSVPFTESLSWERISD